MGIAEVGLAVAGGSAVLGFAQGQSAKKHAKREMNQQREIFAAEQTRVSKQQSVLDAELGRARDKTARGIARSNKRRSKPTLLTESITSTATSPTLGG